MKRPRSPATPASSPEKVPGNRWQGLPEPPPAAPSRVRAQWTKQEDRILKKNYTPNGSRYTAALLGRTISGVHRRAETLGIASATNRRWSEIEDKHLRRQYATHTAAQIARTLKRTEQSVRARINTLGIGERGSPRWMAIELEYLSENYGSIPIAEIAFELGRTAEAVQIKAGKLGLTRSSTPFNPSLRQLEYIVSNFGNIPFSVMARKFGVPVNAIQKIAETHGYRDRPTSRAWSDEDLDHLRRIFGTMTREEVAAELDRTVVAVSDRARRLGLTRKVAITGPRRRWTAEENAVIRRYHGKKSYAEIGDLVDRSSHAIAGRVAKLGLAAPRAGTGKK